MKPALAHAKTTFLVVALLLPVGSRAQEIVGGWEGDATRGYAFGMPAFSLRLDNQSSLVLRAGASYLYYSIPAATGETRVSSPGTNLGFAFRLNKPRVTLTLGPGYEFRWTRRGLAERFLERGFSFQGDVFFQATPLTNVSAIVSYGNANQYVWSRMGFKRQMTNRDFRSAISLFLGPEGSVQGNDDTRVYQAGGMFEVGLPRVGAALQFRSGYSQDRFSEGQTKHRSYYGVGFYWAF